MKRADGAVGGQSKKKKYESRFKKDWETDFPGLLACKDPHKARCTYCNTEVSVSHGGKNDLARHCNGVFHLNAVQDAKRSGKQARITDLRQGGATPTSFADKVSHAEALFCTFVTEHNLPFTVGDHFTELVKKAFPDSLIARNFQCRRTKTAAIISEVLAPKERQKTIKAAKAGPFSIMVDESNKRDDNKAMAVLLRVINPDTGLVQNRFLDMPICNVPSAENLFNALHGSMEKHEIPWKNVKGYSSDNANVMVGKKNSVLSRVQEATDNQVFDLGCVSHVANLASNALIKEISQPVEDLLVDTYYYLEKSSKRKEELKEFQEFTDTPVEIILKHVSTRWLSMERCVKRMLNQWPALRAYFTSHKDCEKPGKVKRCMEGYNNVAMLLAYHFLSYALNRLNKFNVLFQGEGCKILHLLPAVQSLVRSYLTNFVKESVINDAPDVTQVAFTNLENQKSDEDLVIGSAAEKYIHNIEGDSDPAVIRDFYRDVRSAYAAVVKKILQRFPFNNPVLKAVPILNPNKRADFTQREVLFLTEKFLKDTNDEWLDDLMDEWRAFQVATDLPPFIETEGEAAESKPDVWWNKVLAFKDTAGQPRFDKLGELIRILLILPYDQAPVERIFSMVGKVDTKYRPTISNARVCDLLTWKVNAEECCYQLQLNTDLAKAVQGALKG